MQWIEASLTSVWNSRIRRLRRENNLLGNSLGQDQQVPYGCEGRPILWARTCYFDFEKQDKWSTFERGIREMNRVEPNWFCPERGDCLLIVNECPPKGTSCKRDWGAMVRRMLPGSEFVQKTLESERGQAWSLNFILRRLRRDPEKFEFWVLWEESWNPERPFLRQATEILRLEPDIAQLSLNKSESGYPDFATFDRDLVEQFVRTGRHSDLSCDQRRCRVRFRSTANGKNDAPQMVSSRDFAGLEEDPRDWRGKPWPLFSLRPAIHRAEFFLDPGWNFSERRDWWPVSFEYAFGIEFVRRGMVKAVLIPSAFDRERASHVSTYQ